MQTKTKTKFQAVLNAKLKLKLKRVFDIGGTIIARQSHVFN